MTGGMTCEPLLDVAEPRLETALALFDLVQRAEDREGDEHQDEGNADREYLHNGWVNSRWTAVLGLTPLVKLRANQARARAEPAQPTDHPPSFNVR